MNTNDREKAEKRAIDEGCRKRKEMYDRKGVQTTNDQIRREVTQIAEKVERQKLSDIYKG